MCCKIQGGLQGDVMLKSIAFSIELPRNLHQNA